MRAQRTTFMETLDPRVKLVGLILLAFQVLFVQSSFALAGASFLLVACTLLSPITFRTLFSKMLRVFWFVLLITLLNTFTLSGNVFINVFGLFGTVEGLLDGLTLSARLVLLLFLSFVFMQTTRISDIIDALENLLSPFRKMLGPTMLVLGLTVGFVPLLIQSAQQIKRAQIARGADVDAGFFKQIRFAFSAALPLFVAAFRSSHHLAEAMEARAFDPSVPRTAFRHLHFERRDWLVLLLVLVEIVATLTLAPHFDQVGEYSLATFPPSSIITR